MNVSYKTSRGTQVEVKLEGRKVIDLTINGIEVVKNNDNNYDVYLKENFIGVENKNLTKKLGLKGTLKLETNSEMNDIFKQAIQEELEFSRAEVKKFVNSCTKTYEEYTYSFDKHMNDINA